MAFLGLFGNYDKPGPGVSKDEPKKAAPVRFFEILWRKLSKLVSLNLTFLIPFIAVVAMMVGLFFLPVQHIAFYSASFGSLDLYLLYVVTFPLVLLSPFTAGLAYVTRNFAREEHAFVWSDFWDAVKGNWKASLLNGLFVYIAYVALSFSILFYSNKIHDSWIFMVPLCLCCCLALIVLFSQYYVPVMIVTFDLKLRHIYRNAALFCVLGLFRNILITAVLVALIVATLFCPMQFLFIPFLLMIFFIFAFISYLSSFVTYPILDRYLIQPFYQQEAAKNNPKPAAKEGETFTFDADELDDDDDDSPKFVYVNGRLIEKKSLKEESLFSDETKEHLN